MGNNTNEFDIPEKKFDWKTDLNYGHKGEAVVEGFLEAITTGAFEVKTDRYRNGRMVVEMEQNPRLRKGEDGKPLWKPSGFAVTKAVWWVYVYTLDGAFVIVNVARMARYLARQVQLGEFEKYKVFAASSSNPTRGYLLEPEQVMDMLINKDYDARPTEPA